MKIDLDTILIVYLGTILVMVKTNQYDLAESEESWGIDPKAEMYKLPAMHVGGYAERDAEITFGLWQEMKKEILASRS